MLKLAAFLLQISKLMQFLAKLATVDEVDKTMGHHCDIESIVVSVAVPIAIAANVPFEWDQLYLKSAPLSSQISLVRRLHNTVHSTSQRSVYSRSKCDRRKVAVSKSSK